MADIDDPLTAAKFFLQLLRARHQLEALCIPNYVFSEDQSERDAALAAKLILANDHGA